MAFSQAEKTDRTMSAIREESHAAQQRALSAVLSALPLELGSNCTVLDFGKIKLENDAPEFHNLVQIYPLGYRCTMLLPNLRTLALDTAAFEFRIGEEDGGPLFCITNLNTGQSFQASTEKGALKKLEALGGYGGSIVQSFFNIEVELMIEGLDGALECSEYRFHEERGYPYAYNTQDQLVESRAVMLNNSARERRKARRDAIKLLSPEEQKRAEVLEKRRVDEEKEAEKLEATAERERKKIQLAVAKQEKERALAAAKKQRDDAKRDKAIRDEKKKTEEKAAKDRIRAEEKYRTLYRRGMKTELGKLRQTALLAVLRHADEEENAGEIQDTAYYKVQASAQTGQRYRMERAIAALDSCDRVLLTANSKPGEVSWDAAISVVNGLYLFRKQLNLHFPCTIDSIIKSLSLLSQKDCLTAAEEPSLVVGVGAQMSTNAEALSTSVIKDNMWRATAMADRIHIQITKAFMDKLHGMHELVDRIVDPNGGERGGAKAKLVTPMRLPLNQLTWAELARMSIISYCFSCLRNTSSSPVIDTTFAVRGGRGPSWRTHKNVLRRIRYRWYLRSRNERLVSNSPTPIMSARVGDGLLRSSQNDSLNMLVTLQALSQLPPGAKEFFSRPPMDSDFVDEADAMEKLLAVVNGSDGHPEAYRRCASVLIRLIKLTCAKNLFWDILYDELPEYFEVIQRPVCLANVAMHLLDRSYDDALDLEADGSSSDVIYSMFYLETNAVFNNCYTFNTEVQAIVAQAQKTQLAFFRHMQLWILQEKRPALNQCTDGYCLLSGREVGGLTIMRCGHCCANYHLEALSNAYLEGNGFVVPVAQDIVDSNHSEWVCPYCMREDSASQSGSIGATLPTTFTVDEFGPSLAYPWQLNPELSKEAARLDVENPHFSICLKALAILADPTRTGLAVSAKARDSRTDDAAEVAAQDAAAMLSNPWSISERITVLHALLYCYNDEPKQVQRMAKLHEDIDRLHTIAAQHVFKQGDFLRIVDDAVGDAGSEMCRNMLDTIAGDFGPPRGLAHKIFDGRCSICKSSTFPEDQESDESEDEDDDLKKKIRHEVILCDACNAESHLRCLGLVNVPSGDFFCDDCKSRRKNRAPNGDMEFDSIKQYRDASMEENLCNRKIDKMAALEGHQVITASEEVAPEMDTSEIECRYCGTTESFLCSPMVVSQSREEHNWYIQSQRQIANTVTDDGRTVVLKLGGKRVKPPPLAPSYFPHITSHHGDDLLELQSQTQPGSPSTFAAHQYCALELFRARCTPHRNLLRRQRRKVVQAAVNASGLILRPLGSDDHGREYWKFPTSDALYICNLPAADADKTAFMQLLAKERGTTTMEVVTQAPATSNSSSKTWFMMSNKEDIRTLASLMGISSNEQALRRSVTEAFLADVHAASSAENNLTLSNNNDSMTVTEFTEESYVDETLPATITLLENKGAAIEQFVEIASEGVLSDAVDDDDNSAEYFDFGKKYYAIALLNANGKKIRPPKGSVTVTCQVHHNSSHIPLASTPLNDCYSDQVFYFSTAVFHRSGDYTLSFVLEGLNAKNVDPLIYPIHVTARATKAGPSEALEKLVAKSWVSKIGRRVLISRIKRSVLLAKTTRTHNEFESVRSALLTVFAALPAGCLPQVLVDDRGKSKKKASQELRDEDLTEALGWTDSVEHAFYETVVRARVPIELMEALLMLQHHIAPKTISDTGARLLMSLPGAHAAVRAATLPAVALRLFALDRALLYDRVVEEPREKRSNDKDSKAGKISRWEPDDFSKKESTSYDPVPTRVSGRKRGPAPQSEADDFFDEDDIDRAIQASLRG